MRGHAFPLQQPLGHSSDARKDYSNLFCPATAGEPEAEGLQQAQSREA